jgi:glycerophosphoryl diester phosphodiesterase
VSAFPRLFYGHRGAPAELPENTLASFRRAIERGANAIETDAHMTRDGHIVLSHDPDGARMANDPREIRQCTLDEVRRWDVGWGMTNMQGQRPFAKQGFQIPLLEEAVREFPDVMFNVDAKQLAPDMVPTLLALMRKLGAESRVRLASFYARTLFRIRAAGYPGPTGLSQNEVAALYFTPRAALARIGYRDVAAQVPPSVWRFRFDRREFIEKCHSLGIRVDFWVIDDLDQARRLLALGADGIQTDDPARIAAAFPSP